MCRVDGRKNGLERIVQVRVLRPSMSWFLAVSNPSSRAVGLADTRPLAAAVDEPDHRQFGPHTSVTPSDTVRLIWERHSAWVLHYVA